MSMIQDNLDELMDSWCTADAYVAVRRSALGSARRQRPWLRSVGPLFLLDTDRLSEACVFASTNEAHAAIQNVISPCIDDGYAVYPFVCAQSMSDRHISWDCLRTVGGAIPEELKACRQNDDSHEYDVGLEQATVGDVVLVNWEVNLFDQGWLLYSNFVYLRPDANILLSLGNGRVYRIPESVQMVRSGSVTRRYWEQNKDKWLSMPVRQASVGCSN